MKLKNIVALAATSLMTVGGTALFSGNVVASTLTNTESPVLIASNPDGAANQSKFVTVGSGKSTEGTFKVIEEGGKKYIEFSEDFRVSRGPDLEIILHKNSTVASSIGESDYISLASIESFSGTQRYEVPENVDLNEYASVAVWCEDFNVTFGYAPL